MLVSLVARAAVIREPRRKVVEKGKGGGFEQQQTEEGAAVKGKEGRKKSKSVKIERCEKS